MANEGNERIEFTSCAQDYVSMNAEAKAAVEQMVKAAAEKIAAVEEVVSAVRTELMSCSHDAVRDVLAIVRNSGRIAFLPKGAEVNFSGTPSPATAGTKE